MNRSRFEQSLNPFAMGIKPLNKKIRALKFSHPMMILKSIRKTFPKRIRV
jgi:hypothetical protein